MRLGYSVPVFIAARLTVTSADDRESVISSIQDYTDAYLGDPDSPSITRKRFVSILDPRHYQDSVMQSISGVSTFVVTSFARLDNAVQDVAVLEFDGKTEYPILAPGIIAS